jgi:hypothetical protein
MAAAGPRFLAGKLYGLAVADVRAKTPYSKYEGIYRNATGEVLDRPPKVDAMSIAHSYSPAIAGSAHHGLANSISICLCPTADRRNTFCDCWRKTLVRPPSRREPGFNFPMRVCFGAI